MRNGELAAAHMSEAIKLAKAFHARDQRHGIDECESAAVFGLVEAAKNFEPSRGVDFWTYAKHSVMGMLKDLKRPKYHRNQFALFSEPLNFDCAAGAPLSCSSARSVLRTVISTLNPKQRAIVQMYYFDGMTDREISERLGFRYVTVQGGVVSTSRFHALRSLRRELHYRGINRLEDVI
jgi:RNA polymerase sigma factor (sigma-70 family)